MPSSTKTRQYHARNALPPFPSPAPRLPADLQVHLFQYLPQADQGSYLQVSNDLRGPFLRSLKHLRITGSDGTRSDKALVRFLRGATSLEELVVQRSLALAWNDGPLIVDALSKDAMGHRLRSLSLPWSPAHQTIEFLRHLARGGLPCLQKLDLHHLVRYRDNFGGPVPDSAVSTEMVQAIEARRDRGLPPLTELCGVDVIHHAHLGRILACCPPEQLQHLETTNQMQVTVVTTHLRAYAHTGFPRLHRVVLVGDGMMLYNPLTHSSTRLVGEAIDALVACRPPLLRELEIHRCGPLQHAFASLGRDGVRNGAFPHLQTLTLSHCKLDDDDFATLMEALRQSGGPVALQALALNEVWLSQMDLTLLASALKAQHGKLRNLRCLDLHIRGEEWGDKLWGGMGPDFDSSGPSILPLPCFRTLQTLGVRGNMMGKQGIASLVQGLGQGFLPALQTLTLYLGNDAHATDNLMGELAAAWALQHAHGATSRLQELHVQHHSLSVGCLHELTPLFRNGALPSLTVLDVRQHGNESSKYTDDQAASFLREWTALGPRVKLEHMTIVAFMTSGVRDQFLAALADPDFCPFLQNLSWIPFLRTPDVQQGLEKRRQLREKRTEISRDT